MDPHHGDLPDDSLQSRMIRAARLDPALYGEVRDDQAAMPQALAVVLLASVATGIGIGHGDLRLVTMGIAFALAGWYLTAYLTWFIGTRLFPERRAAPESPEPMAAAESATAAARAPTPADLLRTIGFANAPGLVRMLAIVPELRLLVIVGTTVWMLCATVIAIREGLGFQSTLRATAVYLAIQLMIAPLAFLVAEPEAPGAP